LHRLSRGGAWVPTPCRGTVTALRKSPSLITRKTTKTLFLPSFETLLSRRKFRSLRYQARLGYAMAHIRYMVPWGEFPSLSRKTSKLRLAVLIAGLQRSCLASSRYCKKRRTSTWIRTGGEDVSLKRGDRSGERHHNFALGRRARAFGKGLPRRPIGTRGHDVDVILPPRPGGPSRHLLTRQ